MPGDPFREPRYPAEEVRRIVRRAAELAERDAEKAASGRALTRSELLNGAAALGLPESAIEEALVGHSETPGKAPHPFLGAPVRVLYEEEFPGEPSEADREDLIEDIRSAVGDTGTVDIVGRTITWRPSVRFNKQQRDLVIKVRSRDGRTRIRVEESLSGIAIGLFVGMGVGGGVGLGVPSIILGALALKLGVLAVLFPLITILVFLGSARAIFRYVSRRRERELGELMTRLRRSANAWSRKDSPQLRVGEANETAAEEEAEAEEEAAGSVAQRRAR